MNKDRYITIVKQKIQEKGLDLALELRHWEQRLESFHREVSHLSDISNEAKACVDTYNFEAFRVVMFSEIREQATNVDIRWYLVALSFQLEIRFEDAIDAFKKANEIKKTSLYMNECASMYIQLGELEQASAVFKSLVTHAKQTGESDHEANGWGGLGLVSSMLGDSEKSIKAFENAYKLGKKHWDIPQTLMVMLQLAHAYEAAGDKATASDRFSQLEELVSQSQDVETTLMVRLNLGEYYSRISNREKAIQNYQSGLTHARQASFLLFMQRFEAGLGMVYESLHDHTKALTHLEQAFKLASELKDPEAMGYAVYYIALVNEHLGEVSQATQLFQQAGQLLKPILEEGHPLLSKINDHIAQLNSQAVVL